MIYTYVSTWTFTDHTDTGEVIKREECRSRQKIAAMIHATFGIGLHFCRICRLRSNSTGNDILVLFISYVIRFFMGPISYNLKQNVNLMKIVKKS